METFCYRLSGLSWKIAVKRLLWCCPFSALDGWREEHPVWKNLATAIPKGSSLGDFRWRIRPNLEWSLENRTVKETRKVVEVMVYALWISARTKIKRIKVRFTEFSRPTQIDPETPTIIGQRSKVKVTELANGLAKVALSLCATVKVSILFSVWNSLPLSLSRES